MPPLLLLLLAVQAADAGRRKRADKEPDGPPAPALPAVALRSPYPVPTPQLQGPTSVLALQGLTRDAVSFRFETDLSGLSGLDAESIDAVFAQLAADPRWRVGRAEDGSRVAVLRHDDGQPDIGPGGWHVEKERCFRVALRESAGGGEWTTSERVTRVRSDAGGMNLEGFRPDGGLCARLATALRVEGTLFLEVFEAGSPDGRPVTIQAVGDLPYRLTSLRYAVDTIQRDGYDPLSLPEHEPRPIFEPTLALEGGEGQLQLTARVNPLAPGWTWARILGPDGQPWEERAVALGTLEQLGWSSDVAYGFYMQGAVVVPSGEAFQGTVEIWFQPDDEAPTPRLLHRQEITVPAR